MPELGSSRLGAGADARSCSAVWPATWWAITAVVAALTLAPAAARVLEALVTVLLPTVLRIH